MLEDRAKVHVGACMYQVGVCEFLWVSSSEFFFFLKYTGELRINILRKKGKRSQCYRIESL